jgi:hypothetical protein
MTRKITFLVIIFLEKKHENIGQDTDFDKNQTKGKNFNWNLSAIIQSNP